MLKPGFLLPPSNRTSICRNREALNRILVGIRARLLGSNGVSGLIPVPVSATVITTPFTPDRPLRSLPSPENDPATAFRHCVQGVAYQVADDQLDFAFKTHDRFRHAVLAGDRDAAFNEPSFVKFEDSRDYIDRTYRRCLGRMAMEP